MKFGLKKRGGVIKKSRLVVTGVISELIDLKIFFLG
jgi:hypothetical protein